MDVPRNQCDQDISGWDVGSVDDMNSMFMDANSTKTFQGGM